MCLDAIPVFCVPSLPKPRLEHDLADVPAAVDQLMGAVRLVQREGLMDERLDLAGPYQRPDLRFQFADDLRLVVGAARTPGRADVGEALG